jgi:hypothetical protein
VTKTNLRNKLLDMVVTDLMSACPNDIRIRLALKDNEPIPDKCLPGRLIMKLSEEERELLKTFTSEDWNGII